MAKKNTRKTPSLAERVEALEKEIDAELNRMAEEVRPKSEHAAIPAGTIRRMWEARATGVNLFHAYLVAVGK